MDYFDFFNNPQDLENWIRSRESGDMAANDLLDVVHMLGDQSILDDKEDVQEKCHEIYEEGPKSDEAAEILLGVLARVGLARMTKTADKMQRSAESRQRNEWERGMRNKWNRITCSEVEPGTPWRQDRDEFYDFTHNTIDAIKLDANPAHVYSGEALWRMYIMDKFTREHQDKDGKWVGGYINDRFYVFPDAGTPSNPDAPRDGGNQMGLAPGERTRKPRPHQYSIERRLEEARGNKGYDLVPVRSSSFTTMVKVANKLPKARNEDKVYNIFRDTIDMNEAGFEYGDMLEKVSEHYDVPIQHVAQIALISGKMKIKHSDIGYKLEKKAANQTFTTQTGETVVLIDPVSGTYQYADGPRAGEMFVLQPEEEAILMPAEETPGDVQAGADETGLLEPVAFSRKPRRKVASKS